MIIKFLFIVSFYLLKSITSYSDSTVCNINAECSFGFVCLAGNADVVNDTTQITATGSPYYGQCTPTVPVRQICYFYGILTGKLGKAIVALVIISLAFAFITGKIEMKQFITFFFGIFLLFGGFQLIQILTNTKANLCAMVDLEAPLGVPSQAFIQVN